MRPLLTVLATGIAAFGAGDAPRAQALLGEAPGPRLDHAAVFDVARGQMLVFGGFDGIRMRNDLWSFDGSGWRQLNAPSSPPARAGHVMAWDAARQVVVLFGGFGATGMLQDTWEWNGSEWTNVVTVNRPPARTHSALAYDPRQQRCELFGGAGSSGLRDDRWRYDGVNWTLVSTGQRPSPRARHAMCFGSGGLLVFGGVDQSGLPLGDTWFDYVQLLGNGGPSPRGDALLVAGGALSNGQAILLGGTGPGAGPLADQWRFTGSDWQPLAAQLPVQTDGARIVHDPVQGRLLVTGGHRAITATERVLSAAVWQFDGAQWTPAADAPDARHGAAAAFDAQRGRAVLFGGATSLTGGVHLHRDTWEHDGHGWRQRHPIAMPAARRGHAMAFDAVAARTVLFGGEAGAALGDTWAFDGIDWTRLWGPSPSPRSHHALVADARRGKLVLFGGIDGAGNVLGDTWELDVRTGVWLQPLTMSAPAPRAGHAMAEDSARGRVVLFGGGVLNQGWQPLHQDTWEYDGNDWVSVPTLHLPPVLTGHRLVHDPTGGGTLLAGGWNGTQHEVRTWRFDGVDWTASSQIAAPWPRSDASAWFDRTQSRVRFAFGQQDGIDRGELAAIAPPVVASWTRYGRGCTGSAGVPDLAPVGGSVPLLGTTLHLRVQHVPAAGLAWLGIGFDYGSHAGVALPRPLGAIGLPQCLLWIAPTVELLLPASGGSATTSIAIPNVPALSGLVVGAQALTVGANGPEAVSNAGLARIS